MPTEPLKGLSVPTTGSEVGTWGSASINPDMVAIAAMLGGAQTISLSSATTFTLSAPSGSITAGSGPNQAQNAILKFTGTLNATAALTLPLPGYYILKNNCLGTGVITLRAVGTGNIVGVPPGAGWHVYTDGTDVEFVNLGMTGSYLDVATNTTPIWMTSCTVAPYLLNDGTIYSTSVYPVLGQILGSTFGGNGASTFGVPDHRNRMRIPLSSGTTRVTFANSGITGSTWGAAGGSDALQAHLHVNTLSDPGHEHQFSYAINSFTGPGVTGVNNIARSGLTFNTQVSTAVTGITITNVTTGSGNGGNMPPTFVSGLSFIKT